MFRRSFFAWLFGFPIAASAATLCRVVPVKDRPSCLVTAPLKLSCEWVKPSPGDQPVTRAELAAILKEAGFDVCGYPTINDTKFQSVFSDRPSPAFQKLLQQVGSPDNADARSIATSTIPTAASSAISVSG